MTVADIPAFSTPVTVIEGVNTYTYTYDVDAVEDVKVQITDGGVVSYLTYGDDYTVEKVAEPAVGGTITITAALTVGAQVVSFRATGLAQNTSLPNQGAYFAQTVEREFDRQAMLTQESARDGALALSYPVGETDAVTTFPVPVEGRTVVGRVVAGSLQYMADGPTGDSIAANVTAAAASETNAAASETAAAASETAAAASETAAAASETNAAASETAAAASETAAAASETAAAASETNAAASETAAAASETNAAASETAAAASETAAAASETNAAASETNAAASETAAAASETAAAASETAAAASETNAAASETNAAASETNAAASETNAAASETAAAASETAAAASETNAAASETAAAASETNAAASETNAAASEAAAAASYDNFDDRYLGAKASDPTLDNDGDALITGALYFNTSTNDMCVWDGAAWEAAFLPASGYQTVLAEGAFVNGDKTKLDGITAGATPTNTDNVAAAGALMDSEVTNLAQVKAFDGSAYAAASHNHSGTYVEPSRAVSSGTGLTGGGNLSENRTISADVASQAEAEAGTDNAHLMTPLRTAQAIDALAGGGSTTLGDVGTYAWCRLAGYASYNPGDTIAGSALDYVQLTDDAGGGLLNFYTDSTAQSGTWRFMSNADRQTGNNTLVLCVRIS